MSVFRRLKDRLRSVGNRLLRNRPANNDDLPAVGWEAIDAAMEGLYPGQEPLHWAPSLARALGGPDPLDGLSCYRAEGPPLHWHFVSYGMSELYGKHGQDPAVSGWGFELTFRLARAAGETSPPPWAISFLQHIGRYVFNAGNTLGHGHHLDCKGAIAPNAETDLVAVLFLRDVELPPIDTPHGRVEFLQMVGITADELDASRAWIPEALAAVMQERNPLLVTELSRRSILSDEDVARRVSEGQERDGSSTGGSFVSVLEWSHDGDKYLVTLGASGASTLPALIRGRLAHDRPLYLMGPEKLVEFVPALENSVTADEFMLNIHLSRSTSRALAHTIKARRGRYEVEGLNVTFEILPSPIRDADGRIVDEIG